MAPRWQGVRVRPAGITQFSIREPERFEFAVMADEEIVFSRLWTRLLQLSPDEFESEMARLFAANPVAMDAFMEWLEN